MTTPSNHYASFLRLCRETRNQAQAKKLHCLIIKTVANPETFLYNNLINTYGKLGNTTYARLVFDEIAQPNPFSWNIILSAYSDSGFLGKMQEVFNLMPTRDGVSWNSLISGYARHGSAMEAVEAYNLMLREGVFNLNRITFSTVLSLASSQGCIDLGRQRQKFFQLYKNSGALEGAGGSSPGERQLFFFLVDDSAGAVV
ncbi:hypothetical protein Tsubulata_031543 [Turnera subulata]|uniref:Pentacotripeptide-repeat region of PRORP domain-containing protein n=1 Tax=Turnera subulata TaxID=218843 RepID=A0A9Q0J5S2_9ROSI|nr:hypothetical protein Tsubulata_031543 [Turnera subulata]